MPFKEVKEWKEVECDDCGRVSKIVKWIPIRHSACKECGSLKIRLYLSPEERRLRNVKRARKHKVYSEEGREWRPYRTLPKAFRAAAKIHITEGA